MTILLGIFMAAMGHLIHLLKKVVELRAAGEPVGLVEYVKGRPYRTMLGLAGSAAAMGYLIESGDVTAMGALAVGYMADSGLGMLRGRRDGCHLPMGGEDSGGLVGCAAGVAQRHTATAGQGAREG